MLFDKTSKSGIEIYINNLLLYSLLFLLFPFLVGCQGKSEVPKHIFFIVIDTLRADHLSCYGYTALTSPTIDNLSREGILCKNAYSTASSTLESVVSFFTSTTSLTNGIYALNPQGALSLSNGSLQKHLKKTGYNTLAVISNPWLKYYQDFFKDGFTHFQFVISDDWQQQGILNTSDKVTETVLHFLETKFEPNINNFFYIHYLDPHDPYSSPVDYDFFTGDLSKIRPIVRNGTAHPVSGEVEVKNKFKKDPAFFGMPTPKSISQQELKYLISRYDSEIKYIDSSLKTLITRLQEMEILEESLIIITSDHGEEFLEHGCFKHGFQLYDETIHIPLIFYWKNHLKSQRLEKLVSGIDIAPTILELCQIIPPVSMLGGNILTVREKEDPVLFCTHFVNQVQRGMRTPRWKLIENVRTGEIEVFDIEEDPQEKHNLFENDLKRWNYLYETYNNLLSEHSVKKAESKKNKLEIDEETRKQLKALGYL